MLLKMSAKLGFVLLRVQLSTSERVLVLTIVVIVSASSIVVLWPLLLLHVGIWIEGLVGHLHLLAVILILKRISEVRIHAHLNIWLEHLSSHVWVHHWCVHLHLLLLVIGGLLLLLVL